MENRICMNCMQGILDENKVCNACKVREGEISSSNKYLPLRSILRGKYLIGKVIGEGGFAITYLAYDLDLEIRVAIKEFCPRDYAGRDAENGLTISPFDRESAEFFESEKDKFINEAKRLAKFRGEKGIVSVMDYFQENGTAYIVMEYIDGVTLKKYQKQSDKVIDIGTVLILMKPVMESLAKIHKAGMIHRDISPENIMISHDKQSVYLIDFGTAREADVEGERSLSVYKKSSYTPMEQQSSKGRQGAWTDVYALCATIYRCITNAYLPEAPQRMLGEELVKPSAMGITIDADLEAALLHGLALRPEDRIQSMEQLMQEFYERKPVLPVKEEETTTEAEEKTVRVTEPDKEKKKTNIFVGVIVAVLVTILFGVFIAGSTGEQKESEIALSGSIVATQAPSPTATEKPTPEPTPTAPTEPVDKEVAAEQTSAEQTSNEAPAEEPVNAAVHVDSVVNSGTIEIQYNIFYNTTVSDYTTTAKTGMSCWGKTDSGTKFSKYNFKGNFDSEQLVNLWNYIDIPSSNDFFVRENVAFAEYYLANRKEKYYDVKDSFPAEIAFTLDGADYSMKVNQVRLGTYIGSVPNDKGCYSANWSTSDGKRYCMTGTYYVVSGTFVNDGNLPSS